MKKFILGLMAASCLFGCGPDRKSRVEGITNVGNKEQITVYLKNESSMPRERFLKYIELQNIQLQRDFKPVWQIDAICTEGSQPGIRTVTITDDIRRHTGTQGFLGFHNSQRQGYVDWSRTGSSVEVVASHEVMELLTNEYCDPGGREVCDPVNGSTYKIDGVLLADFVYPSYYLLGSAPPWDHVGALNAPLIPTAGNSNFERGH